MTHDGRPTSSARRSGERVGRLGRLCAFTVAAIMTASLAFSWFCGPALAQVVEGAPVRHITVTLNKSKTLRFSEPFSSAVIGASLDTADILPMTEETLYVLGKRVGTTSISVFSADKHLIAVVDLEVSLDTASLHGKIATSTGSGNIKVSSANGQVVLSGEASDAVAATRAVEVAAGVVSGKDASAGGVIGQEKVAPSQQVMLKVRFLEVDRTAGRDLGVNFFSGNKNGIGVSGLGAISNSANSNLTATTPLTAAATNTTQTTSIGGFPH